MIFKFLPVVLVDPRGQEGRFWNVVFVFAGCVISLLFQLLLQNFGSCEFYQK